MQETIYRKHVIRTNNNCHSFTVDNYKIIFNYCTDAIDFIDKIEREKK